MENKIRCVIDHGDRIGDQMMTSVHKMSVQMMPHGRGGAGNTWMLCGIILSEISMSDQGDPTN